MRGAKRKLVPPTQLELAIPQDLRGKLDLYLFSPLLGRVPKGAYSDFFSDRLREFFAGTRLDLTTFGLPGGQIWGSTEALEVVREVLSRSDRLRAENDTLRAIAAKVMPCHYCGADEIGKCPHGFPGCGLADDMMAGEDAMAGEILRLRKQIETLTKGASE